jgi:ATP-dependent RNA helicase HelY
MKIKMPELPPATLLATLGAYNLLPAIVFLPTRRRCDQAASESALARRDPNAERREARREFMHEFVETNPEVRGHRHWDTIIRGGVASHHAGHIPAWKLVIEKLMSAGLLDAIFATATVATGVDFPARTVVVTVADARTGSGWRQLRASELQQMTGRAGRRGKDNVGFIVAAPGLHQDPERIAQLLKAPPDPLVSQFRATYTTLLNLLDAYGSFAQVREIAERSFAHREAAQQITQLQNSKLETERRIEATLQASGCGFTLADALGLERLVAARTRLQETQPQTRAEVFLRWLDEVVQPGRIVGIGRSGKRLVLVTQRGEPNNVVGIREDGSRARFPLERIGPVYAPVYPLREQFIAEAFAEVRAKGKEILLAEPRLRDVRTADAEGVELIDGSIDALTPTHLSESEKKACTEALWSTFDDAMVAARAARQIESLRAEVWQPFERRARVLATFGYLEFEAEKVTERGRWLADLRVDRPLLVGEALASGLFNALDFNRMAAVMAALVSDEDRDYGELELDDALVTALAQFEDVGFKVANEEWKHGFEPGSELNFSAAGAVARWTGGADWATLARETRAEEGDLFRLFSRTGEALLQIAALRRAHPTAARTAAIAAEAVLREPVR